MERDTYIQDVRDGKKRRDFKTEAELQEVVSKLSMAGKKKKSTLTKSWFLTDHDV